MVMDENYICEFGCLPEAVLICMGWLGYWGFCLCATGVCRCLTDHHTTSTTTYYSEHPQCPQQLLIPKSPSFSRHYIS